MPCQTKTFQAVNLVSPTRCLRCVSFSPSHIWWFQCRGRQV